MTITPLEETWAARLRSDEWNQSHLLNEASQEDLKRLAAQLEVLDSAYPGGLLTYIKRARKLLSDSCAGVNPFAGCTPAVPSGEVLVTGSPAFTALESLGFAHVHKLAFVLVAGGLGERLGFSDIKISLPIETCTGMTYIEYYIRMILECERAAEERTGKRPKLPLAIMTSEDTHEKTVKLLKSHQCFGLPEDQITLMMQQKVPALMDNEARFATVPSDRYVIATKPHGHGEVHTLLNQHGLPGKWVEQGLEWMVIFQDTNGLVSHAICPMLGVSIQNQFVLNSLAVPRKAGEAVGAICRLERQNSIPSLTINVEYNQLNPLLAASSQCSDQPDPKTGMSPFPGNANVLLFHLPRYYDVLSSNGGNVPEFVNPKYKDDSKTSFNTPTRLECLMQEFPRLLGVGDKVGITQLDRWLCFSSVKNQAADAALKLKSGGVPDSAFTGECDIYSCYSKMLSTAAAAVTCQSPSLSSEMVDIAPPSSATFLDVHYQLGPKIVMYPSFAITLEQVKRHLKKGPIKVTLGSTLILDGDVSIEGLELDGTLILRASPGKKLIVKNLKVHNKGWEVVKLEDGELKEAAPSIQIRGYVIHRHEQTELLSTR